MRQPFMLPDADCERLKRPEMIAVRMMLAVLSVAVEMYSRAALSQSRKRLRLITNPPLIHSVPL